MSNFLQSHLDKLKNIFSNPDFELRMLLNKSSFNEREIIFSNFEIKNINLLKFKKIFNRRMKGEPLSKIVNSKSFWKYNFFVNNDVLDPRPESELIIENILKLYPKKGMSLKILDMCTGSGCLAISLAKEYPSAELTATDISSKALNVAKINAKNLNCQKQIKFIKCNLLKNLQKYDIIVSNPPYLSITEYKKTSHSIQLFEPKKAFIASNDGYEFYLKIASILPKIIHFNTRVFLEIGYNQAPKVIKILKKNNLTCIKVVKDLGNLDRLLISKIA